MKARQWRRGITARATMAVVALSLGILGAGPSMAASLMTPPQSPELFAPGVVSTDAYEFAITFTPDMGEIYFTRRQDPGPNQILVARFEGETLLTPSPAGFSQVGGEFEPCVSPGGNTIYFGQAGKIRSCTRSGDTWSVAENLPPQVNEGFTMALWVDAEGSLYFTRNNGLMVVHPSDDGFSDAISLGPQFGPPAGDAAHGFVAPDASYMIFDSQSRNPDGGRGDLFLSRRMGDGSWGEPIELAELNTPATEMCASVSPDGRSLFFCRDGDIYWVDTAILERGL